MTVRRQACGRCSRSRRSHWYTPLSRARRYRPRSRNSRHWPAWRVSAGCRPGTRNLGPAGTMSSSPPVYHVSATPPSRLRGPVCTWPAAGSPTPRTPGAATPSDRPSSVGSRISSQCLTSARMCGDRPFWGSSTNRTNATRHSAPRFSEGSPDNTVGATVCSMTLDVDGSARRTYIGSYLPHLKRDTY